MSGFIISRKTVFWNTFEIKYVLMERSRKHLRVISPFSADVVLIVVNRELEIIKSTTFMMLCIEISVSGNLS